MLASVPLTGRHIGERLLSTGRPTAGISNRPPSVYLGRLQSVRPPCGTNGRENRRSSNTRARLKRGHLPVRQLFQAAPHVLGALKPCWAMSPLVVSQLLPAQRCFDLVIFDEASQVTPADAIGALMRAERAIVAGDPHQLPPTSFFATSGGGEDDEDLEEQALGAPAGTRNMESVLGVMSALLPPPKGTRTLGWHYRSHATSA